MDFVPLQCLEKSSGSVPVQVRVCRSWESKNARTGAVISLDLIVADSQGTPMWVQIKSILVNRFRHLLTVGNVYSVKNFIVSTVTGQYRPVTTKHKIVFSVITAVKAINVDVPSIPRHVFQFVSHATVVDRCDDPTYLTDIIGRLICIGDVEAVPGSYVKRDLQVQCDTSGNVRVTLWSELAESFVADHNLGAASGTVIIVLTCLKIRQFSGAFSFSATGGTQSFINLELPEVSRIQDKLAPEPAPVTFLGRSPGVHRTTAEAMNENRMTIASILEGGWVNEKPGYKITFCGRITEILTQYGWYYLGCQKCHRKVSPIDGAYKCPECPTLSPSADILFKVQLVVQDDSDTIFCTAMNKIDERMVDSSAKKLFNRSKPGDTNFPEAVMDLCGQDFIFKIQLSAYNLEAGNDSFTIVDVFTPDFQLSKAGGPSNAYSTPTKSARTSGKGKDVGPSNAYSTPTADAQSEMNVTPRKRRLVLEKVASHDENVE